MNSRERVLKILNRQIPDRLPFNFWMDRSLMKQLDMELGQNFRISHYGADVVETFFQIDWAPDLQKQRVANDFTSHQIKPLIDTFPEVSKLDMPNSEQDSIYKLVKEDRRKYNDKALFVLITTPLDVLFSLRLMEGSFLDLYDYSDEVEEYLHKVGAFLQNVVKNVCMLNIDVLYIAGDICSTKGPLMSREYLKRFCFEPIKGLIDEARRAGIPVLYHTDGAVMEILDMFIEYKIDGINPLQPHLNDIRKFKDEYGDKLLLYGGLDNCFIIPNGTPEEVKLHVSNTFDEIGKNGGFIASTHDIPWYVPRENIEVMVKTLKECVY